MKDGSIKMRQFRACMRRRPYEEGSIVGRLKTTIVGGAANISVHHKKLAVESSLKADRLFFIYVAKEKEWQQLEREDWVYVSAMTRFFKWWTRRYFDISLQVQADILPIVP
jgi:hypothetical protein